MQPVKSEDVEPRLRGYPAPLDPVALSFMQHYLQALDDL
jgi:hypothetical protein